MTVIGYKPGYDVNLSSRPGEAPKSTYYMLRISYETEDVRHPGLPIHISFEQSCTIDGDDGDKTLRKWITQSIENMERHEVAEWLTIDGEKTITPLHEGPTLT